MNSIKPKEEYCKNCVHVDRKKKSHSGVYCKIYEKIVKRNNIACKEFDQEYINS